MEVKINSLTIFSQTNPPSTPATQCTATIAEFADQVRNLFKNLQKKLSGYCNSYFQNTNQGVDRI
jgi:cytidine deaminase